MICCAKFHLYLLLQKKCGTQEKQGFTNTAKKRILLAGLSH